MQRFVRIFSVVAVWVAQAASAQVLVQYYPDTSDGTAGNVGDSTALPADFIGPDVAVSALVQNAPDGYFNNLVWPVYVNSAFNVNEYLAFSLTPETMRELALTRLTYAGRSYFDSSLTMHLRWSVDGFASDIRSANTAGTAGRDYVLSFDLRTLPAQAGTVEFRLYPDDNGLADDFMDLRGPAVSQGLVLYGQSRPLVITSGQCVDQFSGVIFNGYCYVARTPNGTFPTYEAAAQALDPAFHLASIHSAEENAFVRSRVAGGGIWVGVTDQVNEGVWVNLDGTPFDYSNWAAGEPNNQGDEDAVIMGTDGAWNDKTLTSGANAVFKALIKAPLRITSSQCTDQFSGVIFNGYCYVARTPNGTFPTYEAAAQALDPAFHLASIHSAEENAFVRSRVAGGGIWVGVTDQVNEGVWVNLDGTPFDYSNWAAGEPNNQGDEDAVIMGTDGAWNDKTLTSGANAVFKALLVEELIFADGYE